MREMNGNKKILLQINAINGRGSTGEIMKDISSMAEKRGWDSYIASAYDCDVYNDKTLKIGNPIDHKLHSLLSRVIGLHGYFSSLSTRKFLRQIDKIKPDIIQIHNLHSNFINVNMLLKYVEKNKIVTVVTLHDCWFFTGKCYHYKYDECEKWKENCGKCPRKNKEIPSYFFDFSSKVLNDRKKYLGENKNVNIVGVSEWITNEARKSVIKERVYGHIYNGVNLDTFYPKENSLKKELNISDKFIILGMANKWMEKYNKEAMDYIVSNLNSDSIVVLIGAQDTEGDINEKVIKIPYVENRNKLAQIYSMADVFVNLTKVDSLPTVNIEALACGTPVVTYNSGGSSEIIDSDTGFVVDYGNYEGIYESINIVKKLGKEFFASKCVNRAHSMFDNKKCYGKYIELYEQLLAKKNNQRV